MDKLDYLKRDNASCGELTTSEFSSLYENMKVGRGCIQVSIKTRRWGWAAGGVAPDRVLLEWSGLEGRQLARERRGRHVASCCRRGSPGLSLPHPLLCLPLPLHPRR